MYFACSRKDSHELFNELLSIVSGEIQKLKPKQGLNDIPFISSADLDALGTSTMAADVRIRQRSIVRDMHWNNPFEGFLAW